MIRIAIRLLFLRGAAKDHFINRLLQRLTGRSGLQVVVKDTQTSGSTLRIGRMTAHVDGFTIELLEVKISMSLFAVLIGRQTMHSLTMGSVRIFSNSPKNSVDDFVANHNSKIDNSPQAPGWKTFYRNIRWLPVQCRIDQLSIDLYDIAYKKILVKAKVDKNRCTLVMDASGKSATNDLSLHLRAVINQQTLRSVPAGTRIILNGIAWDMSVEIDGSQKKCTVGVAKRNLDFSSVEKMFPRFSWLRETQLRPEATFGCTYVLSAEPGIARYRVAAKVDIEPPVNCDQDAAFRIKRAVAALAAGEEVPVLFIFSLLHAEDPNFFIHHGIDPIFIGLALEENIAAGRIVRGGSTITMQLARTLYLDHSGTIARKIDELLIAFILENIVGVNKQTVLGAYLNVIDFAIGVKGIAAASRFYFAVSPNYLNYQQMLVLIYAIPRPAFFVEAVRDCTPQVKRNLKRHLLHHASIALRDRRITKEVYERIASPVYFAGLDLVLGFD